MTSVTYTRAGVLFAIVAMAAVQACDHAAPHQPTDAATTATPGSATPSGSSGMPGGPETPRWGALMPDVGRRFELIGRAAIARRWDFADFQLEQMEKVFKQLHRAKNPSRAKDDVNVPALGEAFSNTHPAELRAAMKAADDTAFGAAFRRMSETCNGCHKVAGYPFIEISPEPGAGVPRLDP